MATIANLVVNDGASTPIAHTYSGVSTKPALWREISASSLSLAGQPTISLNVREGAGASGLSKVRLVVDLPAEAVIGSVAADGYRAAPKVDYTTRVAVDFFLPNRSTVLQRRDVRARLINSLLNQQIIDAVDFLVPPS